MGMGTFNFMKKLKSHKTVEDKFERIVKKGMIDPNKPSNQDYTTEFGEYYAKDGSIRIDTFMNEATNYITSNMFEMEHKQAVEKYRYMATLPEVDDAIEEVINEAIVNDEVEDEIVRAAFKDDEIGDELKDVIVEEFRYIRDILLDFKNQGQKLFRNWYIDGCLYIEKVFNPENVRQGIIKANVLDSAYVTYFTVLSNADDKNNISYNAYNMKDKIVDEFFIVRKPIFSSNYYNTNTMMFNIPKSGAVADQFHTKKVPAPLITYIDSGLYHPNKYYPYSHLHKALKVSNQLTLLEDALLIYRITRAPERRIFFIEVGNMPPQKAEEYIRRLMRQYRQEKVYDVNTGQINEKGAFMAMTEDFWLPRKNGQSTTEVTTLQGGQNLSEVEDLNYFANKIWRALKVPYTRRADKENNGVQFNTGRELTIEEFKFFKFILKLRREFSRLFDDLLSTQLVAKRYVNSEDIDTVMSKVKYIYHNDNFFSSFMKLDILSTRLDVLNSIDPFVGKYFPKEYVWTDIFELTEEEIKVLKEKMKEEQESGDLPPAEGQEPPMGGGGGMEPPGMEPPMGGGEMPPPPK